MYGVPWTAKLVKINLPAPQTADIVSFHDEITYEASNRDLPLNSVHRYTYDMHILNTHKNILTYSKILEDLHMVKGNHERSLFISFSYTLSLFSIRQLKMKGQFFEHIIRLQVLNEMFVCQAFVLFSF